MVNTVPTTSGTAVPARLGRIDMLRAIACLLIMTYHVHLVDMPFKNGWRDWSKWPSSDGYELYPTAGLGYSGVILFFVISGFCVHYSMIKKGPLAPATFPLFTFYVRRGLRILPAYWVALLASLVIVIVPGPRSWGDFSSHIFMYFNMVPDWIHSYGGHFWTLAVEFQFYLLYPLVWAALRRFSALQVYAAALLLNLATWAALGYPADCTHWAGLSFIAASWPTWILGALLAEGTVKGSTVFPIPALSCLVGAALFILTDQCEALHSQAFIAGGLFFAAFLEWFLAWKLNLGGFGILLEKIGMVSYSIYLWHPFIIDTMAQHLTYLLISPYFLFLPVAILMVMPVAIVSYLLFERLGTKVIKTGTLN